MTLPDGITIRRAVPDDAEALTHLHLDCWDDAYTGLMDQQVLDARRTSVPERIDLWRAILERGEGPLVAEGTDGLVGFVSTGPGRDDDMDTGLEVMALYVRAAWWGTGVGHGLLEQACAERAAYLWVLDDNDRALRFYERQGFRRDGTVDEQDEGLHVRMVRAGR
jgi:GNAT superfamily N-acetyltransferase